MQPIRRFAGAYARSISHNLAQIYTDTHTLTMLAAQTISARPAFLGMRVANTNNVQRQGRMAMRIRAEGEEKQSAAKASPAALRYGGRDEGGWLHVATEVGMASFLPFRRRN